MNLVHASLPVAALSVILVSDSVLAQVEKPTGSLIGRPARAGILGAVQLSDEDRGRRVLAEFGSCTYLSQPKKVDEALALVSESEEGGQALSKLANAECLAEGEFRIGGADLLRGSLFRAKYVHEFGDQQIPFAPEPVDFANFVPNQTDPVNQQFILLRDFADCVVRADPENSRKIVTGLAGSADDEDAFGAIIPQLGPCLSENLKVKFSKSSIEALLAEALYRETEAAQAARVEEAAE